MPKRNTFIEKCNKSNILFGAIDDKHSKEEIKTPNKENRDQSFKTDSVFSSSNIASLNVKLGQKEEENLPYSVRNFIFICFLQ